MVESASIDPFNLPASTPAGNVYPNLVDSTQHARNNFKPRKRVWKRTISAQENEACLRRTLQQYWGYGDFRGPQLDICLSVMAGCDVLVVAPTGIGKSVCFQVPAVTQEYGVTIVVSPLLALMKDQVQGLNEKGIKAAMLYEKSDDATKKYVGKQLSMGHPELRLLYVTPETLFTGRVNGFLRAAHAQRQLARLVIDEAHVIEEWGLTFRAAYRDLGNFREEFRDVPVTAVTASATEDVRDDIIDILKIKRDDLAQWVQPFNRKNLFYEVRYYNNDQRKYRIDYIADFIKTFRQQAEQRHEQHGVNAKCVSGLVYCRARMMCQDVAKELRDKGINALAYHAQLTEEQRDAALHLWKVGEVECIVATIAFGMGVDQAHVRYVIHYDMPKSFEGYYQETGRAGRDGHASRCILFYSREDAAYQRSLIEKEAKAEETKRRTKKTANAPVVVDEEELGRAKIRLLNSFKLMQQYAESTATCRHISICRYFGEQINAADPEVLKAYCDKMCDVCCKPGAVARRAVQITDEVPVASQVVHAPRRFHSASSIPSSRNPSTIANLHLSDAPRYSSQTPRHDGEAAEDHDDGAGDDRHPQRFSDPLDIPTSSPPSTRSRSSRARKGQERPVTSTLSTRLPPSMSVSRALPLAPPAGSTAPPTARSSVGGQVDTNVPRQSPRRAEKRQKTSNTPRTERAASIEIPQRRETHSTLFGRNATPGPSRTTVPPKSAGRARTVSTFDESPAAGMQPPREPMTPDQIQRKAREKEKFMAIRPLTPGRSPGGGPFAYYGNGRSTQGQLRVHASPASGINRPFRSPLIPESQPRVIARIHEENRETARAPIRNLAIAKIKKTLEKVFKEGELGEAVWLYWRRTEKGKKKSKALDLVARACVEELETTFSDGAEFGKHVELAIGGFRILLTQEGADIVLNDELDTYGDDAHGQKLLLLRRLVGGE